MKTVIIFYSFSDNTRRIAEFIQREILRENKEADILRLKPLREKKTFLAQAAQAFLKQSPELENNDRDYILDKYERIIIGSPVWALAPAPAVRSYLSRVKGIEGKKICVFFTFGSGPGVAKAVKDIGGLIQKKKADILFTACVPDKKTRDNDYVRKSLSPLISNIKE